MLLFQLQSMDDLYVKIGDFNLKILLSDDISDSQISYYKNKTERDLLIYLRGFQMHSKPKQIDFEIEFKYREESSLLTHEKSNKIYTPLLEKASESKFVTYYQISVYEFETVLKNALFILLKNNSGFGIHASAARVGNAAYLFLGKSGAGKSTTVELLKYKYNTISDDITFLRRRGKDYYVFQAPFVERSWWIKKNQKLTKVSKVFFLNKSKSFKLIERNNRAIISKKIKRQVVAAQMLDLKTLKQIDQFIDDVGMFYDIYFAKDSNKLISLVEKIK